MGQKARRREELRVEVPSAFALFHADKKIKVKDANGNEREIGIWQVFMAKAVRYDGLVYEPDRPGMVNNCLNMWRGFGVKAKPGDWHLMQEHIRDVLADGDDAVFSYIMKWAAWTVQNPGKQAEVALVFRGGQGTGKGVFGRTMCDIFKPHSIHISNSRQLTGNFNRHMMHTSMMFVDEAFWAGTKDGLGQLKRMITEHTMVIELKGIDVFEVRNCLHMIIASNEDWVVPAAKDERRFMVVDLNERRKQNPEYFNPLYAELDAGGREAMLYDLLNVDLGGWHPRLDVPQTKGMMEQKLRTAEGVDRAMLILAEEGSLPCQVDGKPNMAKTNGEKTGTGFWHAIKNLSHTLKMEHSKTMMPKLRSYGCDDFKSGNVRGVRFPPLAELRQKLNEIYGVQDWSLDEEWQEANQQRFNRDA